MLRSIGLAIVLAIAPLMAFADGLAKEVTKPANWFVQASVNGEVVRLITPDVAVLAANDIAGSQFDYIAVADLDVHDPASALTAFKQTFPDKSFYVAGNIGSTECAVGPGFRDPDANGACRYDDMQVGTVGDNAKTRVTW